jgi:hypothetical protein
MNLQLENMKENKLVKKGDIIVAEMKDCGKGGKFYYLVVEDRVSKRYTLLNLKTVNLMSTIAVRTPNDLIENIEYRMSQVSVVDVISQDEYEVKLKSLIEE